jgi:hypothetical protein
MERRLTMASTPIIRYYDHLRLVYEVQSRMRELRRTNQGEVSPERQNTQPTTPGESRQNPSRKDGGSRVDPPQQSGVPAFNDSDDYVETAFALKAQPSVPPAKTGNRTATPSRPSSGTNLSLAIPAHSGGSATHVRERSTVWTA